MSINADVSVIIPCYNAKDVITRAINSIVTQTLLPREIIIIDDKSKDNSIKVIHNLIVKYKDVIKIKLIVFNQNSGPAKARNIGWNNAISKYIAFLDADDSWHPKKIELQYNYMVQNPNISLSSHLYNINNTNNLPIMTKNTKIQKITKQKILIKNYFTTPTVMLKREISLRFRELKKYSEDYLLWVEILFNGYQGTLIKIPLGYLHKKEYGESGLSGDLVNMWKGSLKNFLILYREHYIRFPLYLLLTVFSTLKFIIRAIKTIKNKIIFRRY